MLSEYVRYVDRKRAIDKQGDIRNEPLFSQSMKQQPQFLRSSDGEGGDNHMPASFRRFPDQSCEIIRDRGDGLMNTIAVGALDDEIIRGRRRIWRAQDRHAWAAEITGEQQSQFPAVDCMFEENATGTENVPGVRQLDSGVG